MPEAREMIRLQRARLVCDHVVDIGRTRGRWISVDRGDGLAARTWEVEGDGWTAYISTRFSRPPAMYR